MKQSSINDFVSDQPMCIMCGVLPPNPRAKAGWCAPCYKRDYNRRNPDKVRAQRTRRNVRLKEIRRLKREQNPKLKLSEEQILQRAKESRARYREKNKEKLAEWRIQNRGYKRKARESITQLEPEQLLARVGYNNIKPRKTFLISKFRKYCMDRGFKEDPTVTQGEEAHAHDE